MPQTNNQRLFAGTSVLAGTSIALAITLQAKFPGDFCVYCAASIAASLTLYSAAFFGLRDPNKSWSLGGVCATTIAITALYATYPEVVTARAKPRSATVSRCFACPVSATLGNLSLVH
jgi:hypothetical protein